MAESEFFVLGHRNRLMCLDGAKRIPDIPLRRIWTRRLVRLLKTLQVPKESRTILITGHKNGRLAKFVEDVEAYVEAFCFGILELEKALEAAAPCRSGGRSGVCQDGDGGLTGDG